MLRAIHPFRGADSTKDFNSRYENLIRKGVFYTGAGLLVETSGFTDKSVKINPPFSAVSRDGMVILEDSVVYTRVCQDGLTTCIFIRSIYSGNSTPTLSVEALSESDFNADPQKDDLILLAKVAVPVSETTILQEWIDTSTRDEVDPLGRLVFRGEVAQYNDLPDANRHVGDTYIIGSTGDRPELVSWNGEKWKWIPGGDDRTNDILDGLSKHRANIIIDEKHASDLQWEAMKSSGSTLEATSPIAYLDGDIDIDSHATFDMNVKSNGSFRVPSVNSNEPAYGLLNVTCDTEGRQLTGIQFSYWDTEEDSSHTTTKFFGVQVDLGETGSTHISDNTEIISLPNVHNRYVTQDDRRFPTPEQAAALQGTEYADTQDYLEQPSDTNRYIVAKRFHAVAIEHSHGSTADTQGGVHTIISEPPNPPAAKEGHKYIKLEYSGITGDVSNEGPFFVGQGPVGSANQWFKIYDLNKDFEYVNARNKVVKVLGVYDSASLTSQIEPSVSANPKGFYHGDVFLEIPYYDGQDGVNNGTMDTDGLFRVIFGSARFMGKGGKVNWPSESQQADTAGSNIFNGPKSAQVHNEVIRQIRSIKSDNTRHWGATFDADVPPRQSLQELRDGLDWLIDFHGAAFESDFVAGEKSFEKCSRFSSDFPFNAGLTLGSGGAEDYLTPFNNPRNLMLADMRAVCGEEVVLTREIKMTLDDFGPLDEASFGVLKPKVDRRIAFYGGWENNLQLGYVYNRYKGTIFVNFYGTGIELLTDIGTVFAEKFTCEVVDKYGNPILYTVYLTSDGLGGIPSSNLHISDDDKYLSYTSISIVQNLAPDFYLLKITADGNGQPFNVHGFKFVDNEYAGSPTANFFMKGISGRGFLNAQLVKLNTIDSRVIGNSNKGARISYVVDRDETLLPDSIQRKIQYNLIQSFDTVLTKSGQHQLTRTDGTDLRTVFKINDYVLVKSPEAVVHKVYDVQMTYILVRSPLLSGSGAADVSYYCSAGSTTDHSNEEDWIQFDPLTFGNNREDDFTTINGVAKDVAFTLDDNLTTLVGKAVTLITTDISGLAQAVSFDTASSFLTFRGLFTGLDIVVVNTQAKSFTVSIDGAYSSSTLTLSSNGKGFEKIKICSGLPWGTHTIKISSSAGLAIGYIIPYRPKQSSLVNGIVLGDGEQLGRTLITKFPDGAYGDLTSPPGTVFKSARREWRFYNGSGAGEGWDAYSPGFQLDVDLCQGTGGYFKASQTGATAYLPFTGTEIEIVSLFGTGFGTMEIYIDDVGINNPLYWAVTADAGYTPGTSTWDLNGSTAVRRLRISQVDLTDVYPRRHILRIVSNSDNTITLLGAYVSAPGLLASNDISIGPILDNTINLTNYWVRRKILTAPSIRDTRPMLPIEADFFKNEVEPEQFDFIACDYLKVNQTVDSHLIPNSIYDLGSPLNYWNNVYASNLFVDRVNSNLIPKEGQYYNIGYPTNKWRAIYSEYANFDYIIGNLIPYDPYSYYPPPTIGNPDAYWAYAYITNIVSSTINSTNITSTNDLTVQETINNLTGRAYFNKIVVLPGAGSGVLSDLVPYNDEQHDLGWDSRPWNKLWVNELHATTAFYSTTTLETLNVHNIISDTALLIKAGAGTLIRLDDNGLVAARGFYLKALSGDYAFIGAVDTLAIGYDGLVFNTSIINIQSVASLNITTALMTINAPTVNILGASTVVTLPPNFGMGNYVPSSGTGDLGILAGQNLSIGAMGQVLNPGGNQSVVINMYGSVADLRSASMHIYCGGSILMQSADTYANNYISAAYANIVLSTNVIATPAIASSIVMDTALGSIALNAYGNINATSIGSIYLNAFSVNLTGIATVDLLAETINLNSTLDTNITAATTLKLYSTSVAAGVTAELKGKSIAIRGDNVLFTKQLGGSGTAVDISGSLKTNLFCLSKVTVGINNRMVIYPPTSSVVELVPSSGSTGELDLDFIGTAIDGTIIILKSALTTLKIRVHDVIDAAFPPPLSNIRLDNSIVSLGIGSAYRTLNPTQDATLGKYDTLILMSMNTEWVEINFKQISP